MNVVPCLTGQFVASWSSSWSCSYSCSWSILSVLWTQHNTPAARRGARARWVVGLLYRWRFPRVLDKHIVGKC